LTTRNAYLDWTPSWRLSVKGHFWAAPSICCVNYRFSEYSGEMGTSFSLVFTVLSLFLNLSGLVESILRNFGRPNLSHDLSLISCSSQLSSAFVAFQGSCLEKYFWPSPFAVCDGVSLARHSAAWDLFIRHLSGLIVCRTD
jgi:hypothetical protein